MLHEVVYLPLGCKRLNVLQSGELAFYGITWYSVQLFHHIFLSNTTILYIVYLRHLFFVTNFCRNCHSQMNNSNLKTTVTTVVFLIIIMEDYGYCA